MTIVAIGTIFIAVLAAVLLKGPHWSFRFVYIPMLILLPVFLEMELPGIPDITGRRAASLGLLAGMIAVGQRRLLTSRLRRFDLLPLLAVVSFSISYATNTDFSGFVHRIPVLVMDWTLPYLFARAFLRDLRSVKSALGPFAVCSAVFGMLALYEARMATRLAVNLWNMLGLDIRVPTHFHNWRWSYLRAQATFSHAITMGTFFVTAAPLAVLWGILEPKKRLFSLGAALACAAGCVASLSRGPIMILVFISIVFSLFAYRQMRFMLIALGVMGLAALPTAIDFLRESAQYTEQMFETTGNVDSAHYRLGLFLIYGREIVEGGFWGDPTLIGRQYEESWSLDNAYIYLFMTGGWAGGGLFCLMIGWLIWSGLRAVNRARGKRRRVLSSILASFVGIALCMGNVWFADDYTPFFWISAALVLNMAIPLPSRRAPAKPQAEGDRSEPPSDPPPPATGPGAAIGATLRATQATARKPRPVSLPRGDAPPRDTEP